MLGVRAEYPSSALVDLHDPLLMSATLLKVKIRQTSQPWKYDDKSAPRLPSSWQPLRLAREKLQSSPWPLIRPAHGLRYPGAVALHNSDYTVAFRLCTAHGRNGDCLVRGRQPSGVLGRQGEQIKVRELPRTVNTFGREKLPIAQRNIVRPELVVSLGGKRLQP